MEDKIHRIDGLKWHILSRVNKKVEPLCPNSNCKNMPLVPFIRDEFLGVVNNEETDELKCSECGNIYKLLMQYFAEKNRVFDRIRSEEELGDLKVKNHEDKPLIPTKKIPIENSEYFVEYSLKDSKSGPLLILYAGKKGSEGKTQIFINPNTKIVTYDKNDLDPRDVFIKVEVTFPDGGKTIFKRESGKTASISEENSFKSSPTETGT